MFKIVRHGYVNSIIGKRGVLKDTYGLLDYIEDARVNEYIQKDSYKSYDDGSGNSEWLTFPYVAYSRRINDKWKTIVSYYTNDSFEPVLVLEGNIDLSFFYKNEESEMLCVRDNETIYTLKGNKKSIAYKSTIKNIRVVSKRKSTGEIDLSLHTRPRTEDVSSTDYYTVDDYNGYKLVYFDKQAGKIKETNIKGNYIYDVFNGKYIVWNDEKNNSHISEYKTKTEFVEIFETDKEISMFGFILGESDYLILKSTSGFQLYKYNGTFNKISNTYSEIQMNSISDEWFSACRGKFAYMCRKVNDSIKEYTVGEGSVYKNLFNENKLVIVKRRDKSWGNEGYVYCYNGKEFEKILDFSEINSSENGKYLAYRNDGEGYCSKIENGKIVWSFKAHFIDKFENGFIQGGSNYIGFSDHLLDTNMIASVEDNQVNFLWEFEDFKIKDGRDFFKGESDIITCETSSRNAYKRLPSFKLQLKDGVFYKISDDECTFTVKYLNVFKSYKDLKLFVIKKFYDQKFKNIEFFS